MRLRFTTILIVFTLAGLGCSHTHLKPTEMKELHSFEYCGGELWGYMVPLTDRSIEPGYMFAENPEPLMGVYLHMHSDLSKDPGHALVLFIDIRSKVDFSIEIPQPDIKVNIDELKSQSFRPKFYVIRERKTAKERFPSPKYDVQLTDGQTNTWSIRKVNQLFYFIKGKPQLVKIPKDQIIELKTKKLDLALKKQIDKKFWVRSSLNIWPKGKTLRDSKIQVRIPSLLVNDKLIPARNLAFNMNYEKTKKKRTRSNARRCPSTEMIFHRND